MTDHEALAARLEAAEAEGYTNAIWCLHCGHLIVSRDAKRSGVKGSKVIRMGAENCGRTLAYGNITECRSALATQQKEASDG